MTKKKEKELLAAPRVQKPNRKSKKYKAAMKALVDLVKLMQQEKWQSHTQ